MPSRPDAPSPPPSPGPGGSGRRAGAEDEQTPHPWWALTVIGLAQLMVVLDATIVNIALPSMQRDLGFADDGRQWVVTAYTLAFGSLLLLGGRLSDLLGRRRTFVVGLIGFGAASALGGAAGSFMALTGARALQGMFGAVLAPSALSLLTTTFTRPRERSRAFGIFGAIAGSGAGIGLLLGGVLTEQLSWRWTLYVNVVIAATAVVFGMLLLPPHRPDRRPRLDLAGTALVGGGLFCLVYGFSSADTESWSDWRCWGALILSALLLACFVLHETRADNPLLPPRVVRDRNRAASFISVFIAGSGMFGVFLIVTYYLQRTLGYSPVRTGLAFLPMVLSLMATAQLSTNVLIPRIGPKPVVPTGMGLAAAGLVWLTGLDVDSTYGPHVLPALVVMGVGLGLVMPSAMSLATLGVVKRDQGVASATVNTMQQVGGSVGTALFNTIAAEGLTSYVRSHARAPDLLARAHVYGYALAYWTAAAFFAAGLLVTVVLYQRGRPADLQVGRTTGEATEGEPGAGSGTGSGTASGAG